MDANGSTKIRADRSSLFKEKAKRRSSFSRGRKSSVNYSNDNDYSELCQGISTDLPEDVRMEILINKCVEAAAGKIYEISEETANEVRCQCESKIGAFIRNQSRSTHISINKSESDDDGDLEQLINEAELHAESLHCESRKWDDLKNKNKQIDCKVDRLVESIIAHNNENNKTKQKFPPNTFDEAKMKLYWQFETAESSAKNMESTFSLFHNHVTTEVTRLRNNFVSHEIEMESKQTLRSILNQSDN